MLNSDSRPWMNRTDHALTLSFPSLPLWAARVVHFVIVKTPHMPLKGFKKSVPHHDPPSESAEISAPPLWRAACPSLSSGGSQTSAISFGDWWKILLLRVTGGLEPAEKITAFLSPRVKIVHFPVSTWSSPQWCDHIHQLFAKPRWKGNC